MFNAAGAAQLQEACDRIGKCPVGKAVITDGFNLSKYIIHTVGPIWRGGGNNEENYLYSAYMSSLKLAAKYHVKSISFPLISSGIYGYPKDASLKVALSAISDFLLENDDMDIWLVVYGRDTVLLSEKLFSQIEEYIDDNYIDYRDQDRKRRGLEVYELQDMYQDSTILESKAAPGKEKRSLEDLILEKGESFSEMLLRLIDQKGLTDVETYKRANVDRRLFSKIKTDGKYNVSKITAISFAIALELNLDETKDLLKRAGYALSPSSKFDLIVEFFINEENYNIYTINEALFDFDEKLLGV